MVIIGSSSCPLKYLAFTARKIFSRYPAVRLVLMVSFMVRSSLSHFQSEILYPIRDKGLRVVPRSAEKSKEMPPVKRTVEYRNEVRICRKSLLTGGFGLIYNFVGNKKTIF